MQSTIININRTVNSAIAPEIPEGAEANYGAQLIAATAQVSVGTAINGKVPLPVGATLKELMFVASGADIGTAAPSLNVSISTAATAPATGNVCSALAMTNFKKDKTDTIGTDKFTSVANSTSIPRGSFLYVTPSTAYTLAAGAVYSVVYSYYLPI